MKKTKIKKDLFNRIKEIGSGSKIRGITLISFVITVIILLILAAITINSLTNSGLLNKINKAKDESMKSKYIEEIKLDIMEEQIVWQSSSSKIEDIKVSSRDDIEVENEKIFITSLKNRIYNNHINTWLSDTIIFSEENGEENYDVEALNCNRIMIETKDNYSFIVIANNNEYSAYVDEDSFEIKKGNEVIIEKNKSLLGKIAKIQETGNSNVDVKGKTKVDEPLETVSYNLHTIVYTGDMILNGTNDYSDYGITLSNNVYSVGNATTDCGKNNTDAPYTVVLKVNGNLTINSSITLTSCKDANGYGGPKGLFIYCDGKFTNNGIVTMTERGAKAEGKNIYLWKNKNGSFEYVPKEGGSGANGQYANYAVGGLKGTDGSDRGTGGGASGGIWTDRYYGWATSGKGSAGTSYSGGSGGGGVDRGCGGNGRNGGNAQSDGGAGGYGNGHNASGSCSGGAGNPGGSSSAWCNGENGTGGLLVIFSKTFENNGNIYSNGSKGGVGNRRRRLRRRLNQYIL